MVHIMVVYAQGIVPPRNKEDAFQQLTGMLRDGKDGEPVARYIHTFPRYLNPDELANRYESDRAFQSAWNSYYGDRRTGRDRLNALRSAETTAYGCTAAFLSSLGSFLQISAQPGSAAMFRQAMADGLRAWWEENSAFQMAWKAPWEVGNLFVPVRSITQVVTPDAVQKHFESLQFQPWENAVKDPKPENVFNAIRQYDVEVVNVALSVLPVAKLGLAGGRMGIRLIAGEARTARWATEALDSMESALTKQWKAQLDAGTIDQTQFDRMVASLSESIGLAKYHLGALPKDAYRARALTSMREGINELRDQLLTSGAGIDRNAANQFLAERWKEFSDALRTLPKKAGQTSQGVADRINGTMERMLEDLEDGRMGEFTPEQKAAIRTAIADMRDYGVQGMEVLPPTRAYARQLARDASSFFSAPEKFRRITKTLVRAAEGSAQYDRMMEAYYTATQLARGRYVPIGMQVTGEPSEDLARMSPAKVQAVADRAKATLEAFRKQYQQLSERIARLAGELDAARKAQQGSLELGTVAAGEEEALLATRKAQGAKITRLDTELKRLAAQRDDLAAKMEKPVQQSFAAEAQQILRKGDAGKNAFDGVTRQLEEITRALDEKDAKLFEMGSAGDPAQRAQLETDVAILRYKQNALHTLMAGSLEEGGAGETVRGWLKDLVTAGSPKTRVTEEAKKAQGRLEKIFGKTATAELVRLKREREELGAQLARMAMDDAGRSALQVRLMELDDKLSFGMMKALPKDYLNIYKLGPGTIRALTSRSTVAQLLMNPLVGYYAQRMAGGIASLASPLAYRPQRKTLTVETLSLYQNPMFTGAGSTAQRWLVSRVADGQEVALLAQLKKEGKTIVELSVDNGLQDRYVTQGLLNALQPEEDPVFQAAGANAKAWFYANAAAGKEMDLLSQLRKFRNSLDQLASDTALQAQYTAAGLLAAAKKPELAAPARMEDHPLYLTANTAAKAWLMGSLVENTGLDLLNDLATAHPGISIEQLSTDKALKKEYAGRGFLKPEVSRPARRSAPSDEMAP